MYYCINKKNSKVIPFNTKGMACIFEDVTTAVNFYKTLSTLEQEKYEVVPCKVQVTFITD